MNKSYKRLKSKSFIIIKNHKSIKLVNNHNTSKSFQKDVKIPKREVTNNFKFMCQETLRFIEMDENLQSLPLDFYDIQDNEYDFFEQFFHKKGYKVTRIGADVGSKFFIEKMR